MKSLQNHALLPGAVIPYSGIRPSPWLNGGGVTRQIASGKLGDSGSLETSPADAWDWRLSIAEVDKDGEFSIFEGISRILTVIDGEGMTLSINGAEQPLAKYTPLHFDGGSSTSATLPIGAIMDLNLMTRTRSVNGNVSIVELTENNPIHLSNSSFGVVLCGTARLSTDNNRDHPLEHFDTVVGGENPQPVIAGNGLIAVVSLEAADALWNDE